MSKDNLEYMIDRMSKERLSKMSEDRFDRRVNSMFAKTTEKMFGGESIQPPSKGPERAFPQESGNWFDSPPSTDFFRRWRAETRASSKTERFCRSFPKSPVRFGKTWSATPEERETDTISAKSVLISKVSALRVRLKSKGSF